MKAVAAILGPAAVTGTYKGTINGNDGVSFIIKLIMTKTSAKLTVATLGTYSSSLSSKQFKRIRDGAFKVDFTDSKGGVTLTGIVSKAGARISGTYVNSLNRTGTFILKK